MASKPARLPKLRRGEGSIRWNSERRQVELRHIVNGKPYVERADTPARCLDLRDERRAELAAQRDADEDDDVPSGTIKDLIADWFKFVMPGRAHMTRLGYRLSADLIAAAMGPRTAGEVAAGEWERFLHTVATEHNYRPRSVQKLRSHLHMLLAHGERHGYVAVNPMSRVRTPSVAAVAHDKVWLDETEFDRMRAHLVANPSTHNTMFLLMLLTGMRPGEASGLLWDAIDFDRGTLEVQSAVRREVRPLVVPELKNKQSVRIVELTPDLVRALHRERREQLAVRLQARSWAEEAAVFTGPTGHLIASSTLGNACRRLCDEADVKRITPNAFRHSNASMLIARGASPADVAKHLGHKDMTMVMETYGHAMRKTIPTAALLGTM